MNPERLNKYLAAAKPLLRGHPNTAAPKIDCSGLERLLSTLREPLRRARAHGDFIDIWAVAGLKRNEVRNTAVLAWLLDPCGSHGAGAGVLHRFLDCALTPVVSKTLSEDDLRRARTRAELRPQGSDRDRVDIVIDLPSRIVFVEVKIDAPEGDAQLQRYKEAAAAIGKPCSLIFLSRWPPKGAPPDVDHITWRQTARCLADGRASSVFADRVVRQFASHIQTFA